MKGIKIQKKKKECCRDWYNDFIFFLIYIFLKFQITTLESINIIFVLIGLIIMVFGAFFNIWGRYYLGNNWANQIKIYKNHRLIQEGPYKIVRHPLYASLIWMFYASALIYANVAVVVLTSVIFIPFMYYRAKQEEKLLSEQFVVYKKYQKKVGMFFPKIIRK